MGGSIVLRVDIVHGYDIESVVYEIYDDIGRIGAFNDEYLRNGYIMFVAIDVVDAFNNKVLELLHGESWYFSWLLIVEYLKHD